jgi:hypothetical protein
MSFMVLGYQKSSFDDIHVEVRVTLNEHTLTMSRMDVPWNPRPEQLGGDPDQFVAPIV